MISITPINSIKFKQNQPVLKNQSRPVFSDKVDIFERKTPSFKGGDVNLHLPVKEIEELLKSSYETIKKIPDVNDKETYTWKFIADFQKIAPTTTPSGISAQQRFFLWDRAHEVYSPILKLSNYFANQVEFERMEGIPISINAKEYDSGFEQMCKATLGIIKNWEYLLNNSFDKNNMKTKEIFQLLLNSANKKAKNNNVKIEVKDMDILEKHKTQIDKTITGYELYNILSNLMRNAVKYTKEGSTVKAKFENQKINDGDYLIFSVSDKGIGIPSEEQEKVLKGERASNAIASGIEGTGYGLRRVFKILETYGDKLEIKSPLYPEDKEFPGTEIIAYIRLMDDK